MLANITFLFAEDRSTTILPCGTYGLPPGGEMKKKPSRQRVKQLHVPVLPSEAIEIKINAANCSMSVAAYLRELGLNHKPKTTLDAKAVLELAKVNGDLGRLGGLLKMWLTNDERLVALGKEQVVPKIHSLLEEIQTTQAMLLETAQKVTYG
jgi:hypothetical protein